MIEKMSSVYAVVAQSVESLTCNEKVVGSIPTIKPVREIQDPNNRFNEFQKSIRATEFDKELFNHSLDIDLMFHFKDDSSKVIVTHKDEIPENFPLSKYGVSYYDKLESFD